MILSRTPLRISFAGGLSDLECYYNNNIGRVLSTTIDKYIYILINESFTDRFKVSYLKTEITKELDKIKQPLIRECVKSLKKDNYLEIISLSDIPGSTGLGSSSAYTVGLLKTLYHMYNVNHTPYKLAEDSYNIEVKILKECGGKQDQFAAAYGGLNTYIFNKNRVIIRPLDLNTTTLRNLENNLMLFYTNKTRRSQSILEQQTSNISNIKNKIDQLARIAKDMEYDLLDNNGYNFGSLLKEEWEIKRSTGNISTDKIDENIRSLYELGAEGCKIAGAGNGGFIIVYAKPKYQKQIRGTIGLKELKFKFEQCGSRIMYDNSKELI